MGTLKKCGQLLGLQLSQQQLLCTWKCVASASSLRTCCRNTGHLLAVSRGLKLLTFTSRGLCSYMPSNKEQVEVKIQDQDVALLHPSWSQPIQLDFFWLRDHCRCESCYNHVTNQRALDLLSIPPDIKPQLCSVEDDKLVVHWTDDHHSVYQTSWLWECSHESYKSAERSKRSLVLWNKETVETLGIARVDINDYMTTHKGLCDVVKSIVNYGMAFVEKVPVSVDATQQVVERIAHVQRTFFGDMWVFSDKMKHSDTAYTNQYLGAHTDNTYLTEAAGLQVFHLLQHDGTGGETLLVDGFQVAQQFKTQYPQAYKLLSTVPVESEYLEPERHYVDVQPVFKHHPVTGDLVQLRFNLYDRGPHLTIPAEQVKKYYKSLRLLAEEVRQPGGEWWLKLRPGTVLLLDNWRLLHGRAAYTGYRKMTGCYVGRADFISKARVLGLTQ